MPRDTGSLPAADLPHVIEQAVETTLGWGREKPVAVIAEYPAHLPAVLGDPEQLMEVVASLIKIALQKTEQGEVKVWAELVNVDESPASSGMPEDMQQLTSAGEPWVILSVSYTGSPVQGPLLAALQEPSPSGTNADQETREAVEALTRCRKVIEASGGRLWLAADLGPNPYFRFALPLLAAQAASADVSGLRRVVDTHLPESDETYNLVLLMVEDKEVRELIYADLVSAGYRVLSAESGGDVLALARQEHPDLILLDLLAREPTAFDVATVLKRDRNTFDIPVLFLTTSDDPNVGTRMGAVNFLVRPVGTGALLSTIQAVLGTGLSPRGRVLVVEPDANAREMLIMMIQSHGYRVTEASGPEEALALAERFSPELVLVNAELAHERDYWLLRGLRKIEEDFDVIVLADVLTEAEGQAAVRRGASGFSETGKLPDLLDQVRKRRSSEDQ